jgi:hypothetical protein
MDTAMSQPDTEIKILSDTLIGEIFYALGLLKTGWAFRNLGGPFRKVANRLATIGVTADRMIATDGFPEACAWMMSHWVRKVTTRGAETVPPEGPLLVVSNHCGAYDFLVIPSQLNRKDIKLISSDIPFLKNLPNACDHLYFTSNDERDRMVAARGGIRHLQAGGALLLFGTGLIDPDPEAYPNAEAWIGKWLPSIDLFLRLAPETNVLVAITSGILTRRWANHPLTRLRHIDWQQRRLAEFGQVLQQLFFPGRLYVSPHVSFAPPVRVEELRGEAQGDRLLPAVIARGKRLLADHMAWVNSQTEG